MFNFLHSGSQNRLDGTGADSVSLGNQKDRGDSAEQMDGSVNGNSPLLNMEYLNFPEKIQNPFIVRRQI